MSTSGPRTLLRTRLCAIAATTAGLFASYPPEVQAAESPQEVDFDISFLKGSAATAAGIDRFRRGNAMPPGNYNAEVYVNATWIGRVSMTLAAAGERESYPCFDLALLDRIGVDFQHLTAPEPDAPCRRIEEIVPGSTAVFDGGEFRLDVSVPALYLRRNPRGYVDPKLWDDGITAARLQYTANVYRTDGSQFSTTQSYVGLNAGLNIGAWRFRHNGSLTASSTSSTRYQAVQTYAQRAITPLKSQLSIGDAFTDGTLFDSVGFRGVQLATDDRMRPDSQRGYAPMLRGTARSNARVQVRQGGNLIYEMTVAPGPFEINDLYPTGYGGDLELVVTEADGSVAISRVPYAAAVNALRPGVTRYSATVGQYRNPSVEYSPLMAQATVQHGLNNLMTVYGGATVAQDYAALLGGAAFNTSVGAFGLDITQSWARFSTLPSRSGQSMRLSFSKLIQPTQTNITVAAYRYSSSGYLGLSDAVSIMDLNRRGIGGPATTVQRGRLQLMVNQSFAPGYGNVYLSGSSQDYWNRNGRDTQFQIGYNNSYRSVSYGISAYRQFNASAARWETRVMLDLTLPLGRSPQAPYSRTSVQYDPQNGTSLQEGVSGAFGRDNAFSYGLNAGMGHGNNRSLSATMGYASPFTTMSVNAGVSSSYRQYGMAMSGGVVAFSGGVVLTPTMGETMAIVEAKDAAGARVGNSAGLRLDPWGRAVVSSLTPFARNEVELDPTGLPMGVQLTTTQQQVAPTSGAVVKLQFASTNQGQAVMLQSLGNLPLPFGSEVVDEAGKVVGTVVQGNRILAYALRGNRGMLRIMAEGTGAQPITLQYEVQQTKQATANRAAIVSGIVRDMGLYSAVPVASGDRAGDGKQQ